MADAQEIVNRLGQGIRDTEAALTAGNVAAAQSAIAATHQAATDGFAYLRDVEGMNLDWDQAAGNAPAGAKGAQTLGGGAKDAPPAAAGE